LLIYIYIITVENPKDVRKREVTSIFKSLLHVIYHNIS